MNSVYNKILELPWAGTLGKEGSILKTRDHIFDLESLQARPISGNFMMEESILNTIGRKEFNFEELSNDNEFGAIEIQGKFYIENEQT